MNKEYFLINSSRSRVKRFTINKHNKDKFFEYIFIDTGKIFGVLEKEPPVMQKREEFKIEKAREEWKKLISQGWRVTQEEWNKPCDN